MQAIKSTFQKLDSFSRSSPFPFPWWMGLIFIVIFFIVFGVYMRLAREFQTPDNLKRQFESLYKDLDIGAIIQQETKRLSYTDYMNTLSGVNINQQILGNLQFLTASTTGFFFTKTGAADGVFSPEAARYAVKAGARAFVFEIWPSMDPLTPHDPVLQVVQEGSQWRRISFNSISLAAAMEPIVSEIYGSNLRNSTTTSPEDDVVIFYLRFRGQPKRRTFDKTAKILEDLIEPYRLDISFNSNRKRNTIPYLGLPDLKGKIIVCTNTLIKDPAKGGDVSPLFEYINYGPKDSEELIEYTTLPAEEDASVQKSIFSFAVMNPESPASPSNSMGNRALNMGFNCVAVNIFDTLTNNAGPNSRFEKYSYTTVPESRRMTQFTTATPATPANYGIRDGKIDV